MARVESEIKLVFADPVVAEAVFSLIESRSEFGPFALEPMGLLEFDDQYFDTSAQDLRRRGLTLRRRKTSAGCAFELKKMTLDRDGATRHATFRVPETGHLPNGDERPEELPDLRALISFEAGEPTTLAIGGLTVRRVRIAVSHAGEPMGVICLDRFQVASDDPAMTEIPGWEIEIRGADPSRLVRVADALCRWFGMIRVESSKLDRYLRPVVPPASRILLDGDFSTDELLGAAYLWQTPEVTVAAVTSVAGCVSARQGAENASRVFDWLASVAEHAERVRVGVGYDLLVEPPLPRDVLGAEGLGRFAWNPTEGDPRLRDYPDAVELQREVLDRFPGEVAIVATGPLSNLAQLIGRYPSALARARGVVVVGGHFFGVGSSGRTEFNMACDSNAARTVVEYCRTPVGRPDGTFQERVPLSFVSLDVSRRFLLTAAALSSLRGPLAAGLREGLEPVVAHYQHREGLLGMRCGVVLGAITVARPQLLVRERYHVEVVVSPEVPAADGLTVANFAPGGMSPDPLRSVTAVTVSANVAAIEREVLRALNGAAPGEPEE